MMNEVPVTNLGIARLAVSAVDALRDFVRTNASRLVAIRKRADYTQGLVALQAGVPQPYISWLEAGHPGRIGDRALIRILEVYQEMELKWKS